jgi:hypothetical protein
MAHYAFINELNIVTQVIVGKDENDLVEGISSWEDHYSEVTGKVCKRTSYNTFGGVHRLGGIPFRKNYAGISFSYNEIRDAFIPPKLHNSWTLNEETCLWEAPTPMPEDVGAGSPGKRYAWDEITLSWVDRTPTE